MKRPRRGNLARRRLRRRSGAIAIAAILIVLIVLDQQGLLLVRQVDDLAAYHGVHARVTRVIDGDTVEIDLPDALNDSPVTRIRLWGIDCPEMARFNNPAEPLALEAAAMVQTLLGDDGEVLLWLESHQTRDRFSRVLAHVELPDGTVLNEALLEAGLARADDRWPHIHLVRYAQVEHAARRRGIGLWSQSERTAQ